MIKGRIIKGVGGFYEVFTQQEGILTCRARGVFRKEGTRPLVGDDVAVSVLDRQAHTGSVQQILTRRNELVRPAVANVDGALLIFAVKDPDPAWNLLDRFLCLMQWQGIEAAVCINKCDLGTEEQKEQIRRIYEPAGYPLFFTSTVTKEGLLGVRSLLRGRTTVVAGPSGAGKSSLLNVLFGQTLMPVGSVSEKNGRGKQTTRHSQIFPLDADTYYVDTPGFGALDLPADIRPQMLRDAYPEFVRLEPKCRFRGCMHDCEPGCAVRQAAQEGRISPLRYENYRILYKELKSRSYG